MRFDGLVTPCYIINDEEYAQNITRFKAEFERRWSGSVLFGYSVKTNNFPYMLRTALAHGFHAEVVSPESTPLRCAAAAARITSSITARRSGTPSFPPVLPGA